MKKYVIKITIFDVDEPSKPRSELYMGKPGRLWESPYLIEGWKYKANAENAIHRDIENDSLSVRLGKYTALENSRFIRFYSIVEIEAK